MSSTTPTSARHQVGPNYTRRRILVVGAAAAIGLVAYEAVESLGTSQRASHYPDGYFLDSSFRSRYRHQRVNFSLGYPAGYGPDDRLPLVLALHGYGGSHRDIGGFNAHGLAQLSSAANPARPLAVAAIDGGSGYWHPHPGDDPMGMVINEFLPMLHARGLGLGANRLGATGISMGGYGAIMLAQHYPKIFRAVAAASPAIFTTYEQVHYANPGAYWSSADFATYDVMTHTSTLEGIPLWICTGTEDPFRHWVAEFEAALPRGASVHRVPGPHTHEVFHKEMPLAIAFLGAHLSASP